MSGGKGGGGGSFDLENAIRTSAEVNRINQFTPFGSLVFSSSQGQPQPDVTSSPTPFDFRRGRENQTFAGFLRNLSSGGGGRGVPDTATITLSPDQQAILDLRENLQLLLGGQALNFANTNDLFNFGDFSRENVEDALFGRGLRLLEPEFERTEERLEQRLANQGIPVGSAAFARDFQDFNVGRDQALLDLADRAILAGGQEQTRALQNQLIPLNALIGALSGTQVQAPTFFGPGQVDVASLFGIQQQGDIARRQAQSSFLGGLLGLGGTLGAAGILSSKRYKQDAKPITGALDKARRIPVRSWIYKPEIGLGNERHIGPYAEDVRDVTGIGSDNEIHLGDMMGLILAAVQELAEKVERLEHGQLSAA